MTHGTDVFLAICARNEKDGSAMSTGIDQRAKTSWLLCRTSNDFVTPLAGNSSEGQRERERERERGQIRVFAA